MSEEKLNDVSATSEYITVRICDNCGEYGEWRLREQLHKVEEYVFELGGKVESKVSEETSVKRTYFCGECGFAYSPAKFQSLEKRDIKKPRM